MDGRIFSAAAAAAASHSCIPTPRNDLKIAGAAYSSSSSLEWLSGNQLHTFNFNTILCYMCQPERFIQKFAESIHILMYMLTKHAAIQEYHWERDLGFFKTIPDDDCSVHKAPELVQSSKPAAAAVAKLGCNLYSLNGFAFHLKPAKASPC
jgi:hypothetical protein